MVTSIKTFVKKRLKLTKTAATTIFTIRPFVSFSLPTILRIEEYRSMKMKPILATSLMTVQVTSIAGREPMFSDIAMTV